MSELAWTESLSAPCSLATRDGLAVAVIEDPGVIEIVLPPRGKVPRGLAKTLNADMPELPWTSVQADDVNVVWIGPNRWRVLASRERIASLALELTEAIGAAAVFDMTGAFTCFRVAGPAAVEVLARVCPLDLAGVEPDEARGTSIARVKSLVLRESGSVASWMILTPRSYAEFVAAALVQAARTPGRLALFEPSSPPPV